MTHLRQVSFYLIAILLPCVPAHSADVLEPPLAKGLYSPKDVDCKNVSGAASVYYYGREGGIHGSHSGCTVDSISRTDNHYLLKQTCFLSADDRPTPETFPYDVEVQVLDGKTMVMNKTTYQHCPSK